MFCYQSMVYSSASVCEAQTHANNLAAILFVMFITWENFSITLVTTGTWSSISVHPINGSTAINI